MKSFFIKTFSHNGQYNIILKKFNKQNLLADNQCMAKNTGKNKKNKNKLKEKKAFKMKKSTLLGIIGALTGIVVIITTVTIVHITKKKIADRTVHIAFYGLSEDKCELLKKYIPQEENIILEFDTISENAFDLAIVKDKYDMIFTWKGEITDRLSEVAEDVPGRILETMPQSLRDKKCVPILLDHCEFSYSMDVLKKTGFDNPPASFDSFVKYLNSARDVVFSPFFCNGAEDRILIDFVGALVMANGGLNAYNKLKEDLKKVETLEDIIDQDLNGQGFTLRSALDIVKEWPKQGLTHPSWFNGRGNDLLYFAEDNQLGVFFTLLSDHRKIPYNVIKNYETFLVPPNFDGSNYGLIAPAIACVLISDNQNCKRYIGNFFTEDAQAELSNQTNLAPVHYRAQAYDRQADDVRFWSASCKGGAVPDLYLGVYQRKPEELAKICSEIRNYVR